MTTLSALHPETSDPGNDANVGFRISDFTLWQLADSAFPTGGFAHSAGLEAAWQHGEVHHSGDLVSFLEASLRQLGHAALPFVNAAHTAPKRLEEFDRLCEAFTTNPAANRASRLQGKALLAAVKRIFEVEITQPSRWPVGEGPADNGAVRQFCLAQIFPPSPPAPTRSGRSEAETDKCSTSQISKPAGRVTRDGRPAWKSAIQQVRKPVPRGGSREAASTFAAVGGAGERPALPYAHFAPVFGAVVSRLGVPKHTTAQLFGFIHLRGVLAAAVRLNIVGPMEAQALQHRLAPRAEEILQSCASLTVDGIAQTSPLLELWQGTHDRLYSRLFQS